MRVNCIDSSGMSSMKQHQITAASKYVKKGYVSGFFKVFNDKSTHSSDLFLQPLGGTGQHSALYLACTNNRLRFVEYIHEKYQDEIVDHFIGKPIDKKPLSWSIESGSFDVALYLLTEYAASHDDALRNARNWLKKTQTEAMALTHDVNNLQNNLLAIQYDFKTTKATLSDPTLANLIINDLAKANRLLTALEKQRCGKEHHIQILTETKNSLDYYRWFSSGDKQYREIEKEIEDLENQITDICDQINSLSVVIPIAEAVLEATHQLEKKTHQLNNKKRISEGLNDIIANLSHAPTHDLTASFYQTTCL